MIRGLPQPAATHTHAWGAAERMTPKKNVCVHQQQEMVTPILLLLFWDRIRKAG